jgi:hypothetical protein
MTLRIDEVVKFFYAVAAQGNFLSLAASDLNHTLDFVPRFIARNASQAQCIQVADRLSFCHAGLPPRARYPRINSLGPFFCFANGLETASDSKVGPFSIAMYQVVGT